MSDKNYQTQRSQRLERQKSGRPTGNHTSAGAAYKIKVAANGQAKRNGTKSGPISSKNP
jgi:hypothetical protein